MMNLMSLSKREDTKIVIINKTFLKFEGTNHSRKLLSIKGIYFIHLICLLKFVFLFSFIFVINAREITNYHEQLKSKVDYGNLRV